MKDGSLEVKTRLHQARLGVTAMSPHFTRSRALHSHDAPMKGEGFSCVQICRRNVQICRQEPNFVEELHYFADKNTKLPKKYKFADK